MDISAYAAFGGMERVAIIAGALIIGYWGYRLYGRDRTPGLIFMGIACAVLITALATGGSYLRSVGTSYQLAGASEAADEPGASPVTTMQAIDVVKEAPEDTVTVAAQDAPEPATPHAQEDLSPALPQIDVGPGTGVPQTTQAADTAIDARAPESVAETEPQTVVPAAPGRDLASSQELGGRIVSVKSADVTLEWARE